MRTVRIAASLAGGLLAVAFLSGEALANPIAVGIEESSVTMQTPLFAPGKYECAKYPFSYQLGPDVNYASIEIVDSFGTSVSSEVLTTAGAGSSSFQVCSFSLDGKQAPFTLQLEISYKYASGRPDQSATSGQFSLQSKGSGQVKCKKGKVTKTFKATKCPAGWSRVS